MTTPGTTLEQELLDSARMFEQLTRGADAPDAIEIGSAWAARLRLRATRARDFPRVLSGELQIPGVATTAEMFAWLAGSEEVQ